MAPPNCSFAECQGELATQQREEGKRLRKTGDHADPAPPQPAPAAVGSPIVPTVSEAG
jgi:hypothetical protein